MGSHDMTIGTHRPQPYPRLSQKRCESMFSLPKQDVVALFVVGLCLVDRVMAAFALRARSGIPKIPIAQYSQKIPRAWMRFGLCLLVMTEIVLLSGLTEFVAVSVSMGLWLASFQDRVPNHSCLGALAVSVFCYPGNAELASTAALLLAPMYIMAGLAKINSNYFQKDTSPGRQFTGDLLIKLGLTPRRWNVVAGSWMAVTAEFGLGFMLSVGFYRPELIGCAVILHWAFGLLGGKGNLDYSALVLTLWLITISGTISGLTNFVFYGAVGSAIGAGCGVLVSKTPSRNARFLLTRFTEGGMLGYLSAALLVAAPTGKLPVLMPAPLGVNVMVCGLYLLAFVALRRRRCFYGCFAMFSGVDPRQFPNTYWKLVVAEHVQLKTEATALTEGGFLVSRAAIRWLEKQLGFTLQTEPWIGHQSSWSWEREPHRGVVALVPPIMSADTSAPYYG